MPESVDGFPEQVRRLALYGTRGVVARCRDFTAAALRDWGWIPPETEEAEQRVEDVLLLVSEVVTNACLHADGPEELVLRHGRAGLRVEVADTSPEHPSVQQARSPALPGGHGLMVLDRLAGDWGSEDRGQGVTGKVVWLEISRPSGPQWGPPGEDPS